MPANLQAAKRKSSTLENGRVAIEFPAFAAGTAREATMKKSLKGALLSGLVFPGLGQLWLKRYLLGMALVIATCGAAAVVVARAAHEAVRLIEKAESAGATVDIVAIVNSAGTLSSAPADAGTTAAMLLMVGCWILSMVDAYIAGSREDRAAERRGGEGAQKTAARPEGRG
jgi:TM2 domain-containing membrane protein YozV